MIAVLPAVIKRDINRWTFEIYVTDTLQAIAENTAVPAAGFSDGKHGKAMTRRWADKDNYYLYEDDGQLSMIPWDYNLAFGTFQGGDAASQVNAPIDSPVSSGASDDRPMVDWIFSGATYTKLYHQRFAEFLEAVDISALIDETAAMIAPYVEKDPTKFYSYEEFTAGVAALKKFCLLRSESIAGQLAGTIPSTTAGQTENPAALVDASGLTLSDMGTMNAGRDGFQGGRPEKQFPQNR